MSARRATGPQLVAPGRSLARAVSDRVALVTSPKISQRWTMARCSVPRGRGMWRFECEASVDGKVAVEAEILMAVGKEG